MKKILMAAILTMTLPASADNYGFLTFETVDGNAASIGAVGTVITFSNGQLTAVADGMTVSLPLESLSKMYFSNTSGWMQATEDKTDTHFVVYNLMGVRVGFFCSMSEARARLPQGVYVVKNSGQAKIMTIK